MIEIMETTYPEQCTDLGRMMHPISMVGHRSFEPEATLPLKLETAMDVYVVVSLPIPPADTMIDVAVEISVDMVRAYEFFPID